MSSERILMNDDLDCEEKEPPALIINENKEDELKKFELYLNLYNLSSFYNYENYEIEAWKVYKKISDDYSVFK
jgi:hypothetical protein